MMLAATFAAMTLFAQDPVPEWTRLPVGYQELAAQYARTGRQRQGSFANIWLVTVLKDPASTSQGSVHGYEYLVT
jgi:hypothetical protein